MNRFPRLPDLLTIANLTSGVASIAFATQGQLTVACALIFLGALCDVFDGLVARAMGGGSELGKQLDSLADLVTFGVAPMFVLYGYLTVLNAGDGNYLIAGSSVPIWTLLLIMPAASAWRLAKFNIDTRQTTGFLGVPTPANGLFWAGLFSASISLATDASFLEVQANRFLHSPKGLVLTAWVLSILLVTEIPLPSLKLKSFAWRGNQVMYILLLCGVLLAIFGGILAIPLTMVLYILSPLWGRVFGKG